MFDSLYEWIRSLAFYLVMVTAVIHMLPDSDYKKYIRFFTGLVLILLLMTPILRIFGMEQNISQLYENAEYEEKIREIEEKSAYLYDVDGEQYLDEAEENYMKDNTDMDSKEKDNVNNNAEQSNAGMDNIRQEDIDNRADNDKIQVGEIKIE